MRNYIKSAEVNILSGLFKGSVDLLPGLNIISGENGTLKTKFLQALRGNQGTLSDPTSGCTIQAISPKRNAERRTFQTIFNQFRQQNTKLDSLINPRKINDATFDNYPSMGDLYYVVYDDMCKDGGNQKDKMLEVTQQFNKVIRSLFSHYELVSEWNTDEGRPTIELLKSGTNRVPLEGLSLGEQEMLALVTSLYTSRDRYDVFLIDEPEVHLNWHLEEALFRYLDEFCTAYEKQMVVVTHSRAVFKERFLPMTQFFVWSAEGHVICTSSLTRDQRTRIAGDAIEIVRLGDFTSTTFFVEDEAHGVVLEALSRAIGAEITITKCGNSSNVRSLYKHSKREDGWTNCFFLEDGDNEGNPFPGDQSFVHLAKYCIENYLLDFSVASVITKKTEDDLRTIALDAILAKRGVLFRKNRFFEFLVDSLKAEDLTDERLARLDASAVMDHYLQKVGLSFQDYVRKYIEHCAEKRILQTVLPERLVEIIASADR